MVSRPLVYITLALAVGILAANFYQADGLKALLMAAGFLMLTLGGYAWRWPGTRWFLLLTFVCLGFFMGWLETNRTDQTLSPFFGNRVTLEGTVVREPDIRRDRIYYLLAVNKVPNLRGVSPEQVSGRVLVRVSGTKSVYSYGDRLRVSGLLAQPDEPGNPGQFNYRVYLARQGIGAVLYVGDSEQVTRLGLGEVDFLTRTALGLKEKLVDVGRQTLPVDQAAVVNGIVFGTRGEIDPETNRIFSETGVAHILSVSGLHVGLVLGGVLGLAGILRLPQTWQAPFISLVLIVYAIMTGLGPAVLRATVMALLLLWASRLGREADWPTSMALAALGLLLLNPNSLYDAGFQLSFAATWGILYLGPVLDRTMAERLNWLRWLRGLLAIPLAAQLGTLPLVAWYFNLLSPVSLLANLLAVPLVGLILALGAGAALTGIFMPGLAAIINISTGLLVTIFNGLVSLMHALPGAVVFVPTPSILLVAVWYPLLWLAVRLENAEGRQKAADFLTRFRPVVYCAAAGLILVLALFFYRGGEDKLTIHFIDVGQGDSIYVQTPSGRSMLVDAGGKPGEFESGHGVGDGVVVPYLRRLGVQKLDVLVITHPHEDHAGGAMAVSKAFPVELVVVSPFGTDGENSSVSVSKTPPEEEVDQAYYRLLQELSSRGAPVKAAGVGDRLSLDPEVEITILGPPRSPLQGTRSDSNNASLVLRLRHGDKDILLTGDMEQEAQNYMMQKGAAFPAAVLKVPHHGSRFSQPEFFEAVKPDVAVVSVGSHNRFGHPAPETLAELDKSGCRIYRTDRDGAVILESDGGFLRVKTGKARE